MCCLSDHDATLYAARRTRLDLCDAEGGEATGSCDLRHQDFSGASGEHMYCLIMAIRLDTLPTDPTVLTEMVLALDAENEQLRAVVQTLKDMIFGARSERLVAVADEQLALELNDLETGVTPPPAANDDKPTRLSAKTRKKATRNIGALPKHLPRCEQVVEPETTVCPCCQGPLHKIGEDINEVLDVIPAILRVLRIIRPKYGCRGCIDGARGLCAGLEVRLVSAAVSSSPDLGWLGCASRPLDAGFVGEARGVEAQKPLRAAAANHPRLAADLLR